MEGRQGTFREKIRAVGPMPAESRLRAIVTRQAFVFDASLRTPVVYAVAVRYQTPLWRAGALLRAGCMAGFWVLLLWFPHRTWPKDAAMLALGSAGAVTAWAHNRSSLLDFLVARDIAGLSAAARHLIGARERATADLSGLLEGFGIISVALLFAGPLEVRPLPGTVYALGMVLIVIHVWSAFLQAMTDSSWYVPDPPPGRAVLILRPLMPLLVALILFAILAYPVYWRHQAVPGGLFGAILAAAVVLLLWPFTLIYELVAARRPRRGRATGPPVPGRRRHHRAQPGQERGLRADQRGGLRSRRRAGDQVAGPGDAGADRGGQAHGPRPGRRARHRGAALALRDPDPARRRRHHGGDSTRPAVRYSSAAPITSWRGAAWWT